MPWCVPNHHSYEGMLCHGVLVDSRGLPWLNSEDSIKNANDEGAFPAESIFKHERRIFSFSTIHPTITSFFYSCPLDISPLNLAAYGIDTTSPDGPYLRVTLTGFVNETKQKYQYQTMKRVHEQ